MGTSFTCLTYHLVYGPKNRMPVLTPGITKRLYPYMGGILRNLGGKPILMGGMPDHVHVLAFLSPTRALDDVVCALKANSSRWMHEALGLGDFAWQEGYGGFTVGYRGIEGARDYILNQAEHHREEDFLTEYRRFLEWHEIAFDPRYL